MARPDAGARREGRRCRKAPKTVFATEAVLQVGALGGKCKDGARIGRAAAAAIAPDPGRAMGCLCKRKRTMLSSNFTGIGGMVMTKRLIVMLATILLSACISFLPTYDQAVHKQLEGAVGEINKIGTAVSLPYRRPAFSEVEPYYISAFSNLKAAEEMAAGRVQAFRGSLPSRAATILARAISNCRQALEQLRELHRTQGINEADFTESSVRRTCTIPQMMEERLKR